MIEGERLRFARLKLMNVMSLVGLAFSGKRKALRSNRLSTGIDKRDVKANFTIRPDPRVKDAPTRPQGYGSKSATATCAR